MSYNKKSLGDFGENIASNYLLSKNHTLLNKNFRNHTGEIDIISKINNIIVFTEVKSRYSQNYGTPSSSVTYYKQNKIKNLAKYYLYINNISNLYVRFDVIEILLNYYDNNYKITHIEDAFR